MGTERNTSKLQRKSGEEKIIKDREIPNKKTRILRRFPNQILVGEQRELSRTLV